MTESKHCCVVCGKSVPEVNFYNKSYVRAGLVVRSPMKHCTICLKYFRYRRKMFLLSRKGKA